MDIPFCKEVALNELECSSNRYLMKLESPEFIIKNRFWYYLFLFGTELGDEIFYSAFIPFWFWNIDGTIGRKVILVWAVVMSIGKVICSTYFYDTRNKFLSHYDSWSLRYRTSIERCDLLAKTGVSTSRQIAKQMVRRIWDAVDSCHDRNFNSV